MLPDYAISRVIDQALWTLHFLPFYLEGIARHLFVMFM